MLPFDNRLMTGNLLGKEVPKPITDGYGAEPDKEYKVVVPDSVVKNTRDAVIAWIRRKNTVDVPLPFSSRDAAEWDPGTDGY